MQKALLALCFADYFVSLVRHFLRPTGLSTSQQCALYHKMPANFTQERYFCFFVTNSLALGALSSWVGLTPSQRFLHIDRLKLEKIVKTIGIR